VWYYNHVYGQTQAKHTQRARADINGGGLSNCAKAPGAIWYYERAKGSEA
jgi:ribonuclease T2